MRFPFALVFLTLAILSNAAAGQDRSHPTRSAAGEMRLAATHFVATLPDKLAREALRPFEDADRVNWHFTPRSRSGISFKQLDAKQQDAVHALLKQALSVEGYRRVTNIIELELVLREIETFGLMRDPEKYHLTIYGAPDARKAWGWRFEGHHLSLNFTLAGELMVVDTPSFFGANPAEVKNGPKKGLRVLKEEEDEARALLAALTDAQRKEAVFDTRTYGDIVTGAKDRVEPLEAKGIGAEKLNDAQRAQLVKLIGVYADNFEPSIKEARKNRVQEGGIANIRFGWAGATERGRPHYYRIQGPSFLIEYDSSQNNGNHIHTVWRDFTGDFGRDLLSEHYARAQGTGHKH
ncbi:MAG: DUF3500 domain-containing protein [Casimicrobiaceae bacterium]